MKTKNASKRTISAFPDPLGDLGTIARPLVAMAKDYAPNHLIPTHSHSRAQLLYSSTGVMSVFARDGYWVVPPQRGVWIPAGTEHRIECSGIVSLRTLYLDPAVCLGMPESCCVVSISALMRELIIHATNMTRLYRSPSPEERIIAVILDQIHDLKISPLELVIPDDPRLALIYEELRKDPSEGRTLSEWGSLAGASGRTLARLFRSKTGMSFGQWRQQIRLLAALRLLGHGESVTSVALEVGYDSPSAFIAMFKRALGQTPHEYFQKRD